MTNEQAIVLTHFLERYLYSRRQFVSQQTPVKLVNDDIIDHLP